MSDAFCTLSHFHPSHTSHVNESRPFTDPVTLELPLTLAHAHLLHPISHPGFQQPLLWVPVMVLSITIYTGARP